MIIDEIKSANIQAMKDKDQRARGIYSVLMNKHLVATVESRTSGKEVEDADMVRIIQKTINRTSTNTDIGRRGKNNDHCRKIRASRT